MYRKLTYFAVGTVVGPIVANILKPFALSLVRNGFVLAYEAKNIAAQVREDVQDMAAEARVQSETASQVPPVMKTPRA